MLFKTFPNLPLQGLDCCSDNAVSFHYVSPNQMYVLDYLIYHLRPYGIINYQQPLPKKLVLKEVFETLEDERNLKKIDKLAATKELATKDSSEEIKS
jgi:glycoprotein-N-acetylgalactosamine 3-beta-galactosyltransferase